MKLLWYLLLCVPLALASNCPTYWPPSSDTTCGFTRDQAYACVLRHINTDGDSVVTKQEIKDAIAAYAPWYVRALSWFAGVDGVMAGCDYDKNGVLSARDWEMSKATCLPDAASLCQFQWFCRCAGDA